jgi:hypothetical protein
MPPFNSYYFRKRLLGHSQKRVEPRYGAAAFALRFHIPLIEPDVRV